MGFGKSSPFASEDDPMADGCLESNAGAGASGNTECALDAALTAASGDANESVRAVFLS